MNQPLSPDKTSLTPLIVGLDWADSEHVACVLADQLAPAIQTFQHDPQVIADWIGQLQRRYPLRLICIALEQSRGALVHALQFLEGVQLYPINPKQLARFREALYPSGRKSDPVDAELIARLLLNHREQLRLWKPDDAITRELAYLVEFRRKLVDERKSLELRLQATLKLYFPLILTLFKQGLLGDLVLDLLQRWPSLTEIKRPHLVTLREFFRKHGISRDQEQTTLIESIRSATPLTKDGALIHTHALYVQAIARQIRELNQSIAEFDARLKSVVATHPDQSLFRALPGAGDVLVPRLIAAFGSDRDRYQSAEEIQTYSGIAPITKQSGKSRHVSKRIACPKFLRQTFHEFADQARRWSPWSRAYYNLKKSQGMKHQAAVRTLAFKWIRILFRLWKSKSLYSEEQYIKHLVLKRSPLVPLLNND